MKVYPHTSYHSIPDGSSEPSESRRLHRTISEEAKAARRRSPDAEPGTSPTTYTTPAAAAAAAGPSQEDPVDQALDRADVEAALPHASDGPSREAEPDETSSLMSKSSSSMAGDVYVQASVDLDRSHRVDIRGWRLLRSVDFWQLFAILGLLAGIGLMTIK
jgi:hypothetical protein